MEFTKVTIWLDIPQFGHGLYVSRKDELPGIPNIGERICIGEESFRVTDVTRYAKSAGRLAGNVDIRCTINIRAECVGEYLNRLESKGWRNHGRETANWIIANRCK